MREYKRDWLNINPEYTGTVGSSIEIESEYSWIHLELRDCSRAITLDFTISSQEDKDNALYKLKTLREHLDIVEKAVNSAKIKNSG